MIDACAKCICCSSVSSAQFHHNRRNPAPNSSAISATHNSSGQMRPLCLHTLLQYTVLVIAHHDGQVSGEDVSLPYNHAMKLCGLVAWKIGCSFQSCLRKWTGPRSTRSYLYFYSAIKRASLFCSFKSICTTHQNSTVFKAVSRANLMFDCTASTILGSVSRYMAPER